MGCTPPSNFSGSTPSRTHIHHFMLTAANLPFVKTFKKGYKLTMLVQKKNWFLVNKAKNSCQSVKHPVSHTKLSKLEAFTCTPLWLYIPSVKIFSSDYGRVENLIIIIVVSSFLLCFLHSKHSHTCRTKLGFHIQAPPLFFSLFALAPLFAWLALLLPHSLHSPNAEKLFRMALFCLACIGTLATQARLESMKSRLSQHQVHFLFHFYQSLQERDHLLLMS